MVRRLRSIRVSSIRTSQVEAAQRRHPAHGRVDGRAVIAGLLRRAAGAAVGVAPGVGSAVVGR